jgi:hypothetical protein
MTPLAAYLAKQMVERPKHREGVWRDPKNVASLRKTLDNIHCFEISRCMSLISDTQHRLRKAGKEASDGLFATFGFLPAPKTWIEWKLLGSEMRLAVLLTDSGSMQRDYESDRVEGTALVTLMGRQSAATMGWVVPSMGRFLHEDNPYEGIWPEEAPHKARTEEGIGGLLSLCQIGLVLINSPRIIGRSQHMPNRALERELTRGFGRGKFPLHAWTEIKLEVAKPPEIDDGEPHEAHLTGRRALHFCRKHIRIRNGQLEYVSAHWRGDPALGIKRARYMVTA